MLATQDVYPSSTAHLTNDERRQRLREKAYFIDMQMLSFAQETAEFAATDAWDEDGSASAVDWIRFNCYMTSNAAADLIAVGKNLQRMPESTQAVFQVEIGFAHVKRWPGRRTPWGTNSTKRCYWKRRARTRRASSITSATTIGMPLTAKALRQSGRSWWRTAGSGSASAKTAASCSAEPSTPKAARRFERPLSRWRASQTPMTTGVRRSAWRMPRSISRCMRSTAG